MKIVKKQTNHKICNEQAQAQRENGSKSPGNYRSRQIDPDGSDLDLTVKIERRVNQE
jgi:hypothetical protein